eukprot:Blabericola_migrator_1__123@NODE_1030_length_5652_cov_194_902238_g710_i0_p2_GENE_NODE_1030_length_5652_cov_194_902238_g710_i0NODE_1030_length_5652_cov_194_902238_g710_i0_p2_ORF_typecomplete_len481_score60_96APH/PF01636_23/0_24_NODE_1030_length_5652_cov_194_902238_g710_i035394981
MLILIKLVISSLLCATLTKSNLRQPNRSALQLEAQADVPKPAKPPDLSLARLEAYCKTELYRVTCETGTNGVIKTATGTFGRVAFGLLSLPLPPHYQILHSCKHSLFVTPVNFEGCQELDQTKERYLKIAIKTWRLNHVKVLKQEIINTRRIRPLLGLVTASNKVVHSSPQHYDIIDRRTRKPVHTNVVFQDWIAGQTIHDILKLTMSKYDDVFKRLNSQMWSKSDRDKLMTRFHRTFRDFLTTLDLVFYSIPIILWGNDLVHCDLHLKNIMLLEHYTKDEKAVWEYVRNGQGILHPSYSQINGIYGPVFLFSPSDIRLIDLANVLNVDVCSAAELTRPCMKCKNTHQLEDASFVAKALLRSFLTESLRPLKKLVQMKMGDETLRRAILNHDHLFMVLQESLSGWEESSCVKRLELWTEEYYQEALKVYQQTGMECTIPDQRKLFSAMRGLIADGIKAALGPNIRYQLQIERDRDSRNDK